MKIMTKLLLAFAFLWTSFGAQTQCSPDATLNPNGQGIYPDTIQNLVVGVSGQPYVQVLHFNFSSLTAGIQTFSVISYTVLSIDGLPLGLDYTCNISTCTYPGGAGCLVITGTPTEVGEYAITLNFSITYNFGFGLVAENVPFDGYQISIGCPTDGLAFVGNPTAGTSPLTVIFDNQTPNLAAYNFQWDFGDGYIENNNASFVPHLYSFDGLWDVTLTATDAQGCVIQLVKPGYIFTTGGVSSTINENDKNEISFYPNPTSTYVTIEVPEYVVGKRIYVYNLNGKIILETMLLNTVQTINMENVALGSYYLKIENDGNAFKLIKF